MAERLQLEEAEEIEIRRFLQAGCDRVFAAISVPPEPGLARAMVPALKYEHVRSSE